MEIAEKVKEIIADQLGIHKKEVVEDANLINDLQVETIDIVNFITEFEVAFQISILDSDFKNISTVKEVIDYLELLISKK